jgi:hypothetical protein
MIPGTGNGPLLRAVEWNLADAGAEIVDALPGAALLDHRHDAPHVTVMLEGELKEEGRTYHCADVRFSPSGDRHFLRFTCRSKCLLIHLSFRHEVDQLEERCSTNRSARKRRPARGPGTRPVHEHHGIVRRFAGGKKQCAREFNLPVVEYDFSFAWWVGENGR